MCIVVDEIYLLLLKELRKQHACVALQEGGFVIAYKAAPILKIAQVERVIGHVSLECLFLRRAEIPYCVPSSTTTRGRKCLTSAQSAKPSATSSVSMKPSVDRRTERRPLSRFHASLQAAYSRMVSAQPIAIAPGRGGAVLL